MERLLERVAGIAWSDCWRGFRRVLRLLTRRFPKFLEVLDPGFTTRAYFQTSANDGFALLHLEMETTWTALDS